MPFQTPSHTERRHWRLKRAWTLGLLLLWLLVAFGTTFFARDLDAAFPGKSLAFWIAAQGAPLAFLGIVVVYAAAMDWLDARHRSDTPS